MLLAWGRCNSGYITKESDLSSACNLCLSRVPFGGKGSIMSPSQATLEMNMTRQGVGRLATCTLVLNLSMSNEE